MDLCGPRLYALNAFISFMPLSPSFHTFASIEIAGTQIVARKR
jgi:hypothetical protein